MNTVSVSLLYNSPVGLAVYAARTCANSTDKMQSEILADSLHEDDLSLLQKRILAEGAMSPAHESVIEHVVYTFEIRGVSRALLQELMRHRIASPSVQSTRYALGKLLSIFKGPGVIDTVKIDDMIVLTGDDDVDDLSRKALIGIVNLMDQRKVPNDRIKFSLPEAFRTRLLLTINARSLRNLFVLRTSKRAMWEIRRMAFAMVDEIPEGHSFLYEDRVHDRPDRFRRWLKNSERGD